jgi:putative membrane-bound dehydrogenase-like protein
MNRRFLSLAALALLAAPSSAQVPPDKALSTFTVADGLQIEMFAHEPMLINPTSIDVDEKGRVWVCEAVNYRRVNFGRPILRPEGDRIVVLEDTDGDGKADKSHVFYQGKEIIAPLGIAVAPYPNPDKKGAISYKVFVCQSPDILLFEDKDGDLKADGPPKKFLTGFQGIDHDHGVHGINIGPDGKLYFTVGDAGVRNLQSSDGKGPKFTSNATDCRAGTVWRCDLDGTNLELIAHNFRNNYECCVNSFGEVWLSDNDDDGNQQTRICFVMPGGNYGYHPRGQGQSHWHEEQPGIVHKALRTGFGSPTGICFYEGTLLPEKYRGQLLHCDAGPREFRCFHLKPKGAGYELQKENLVTSTDNWFRLSDCCVAPDGSVFLSDWYDPGVGGHGMGDWTRGRIYRITPKGHKGYKVPEVQLDTKEGILAALGSPCLATRAAAQGALFSLKKQDAFEMLQPIATEKIPSNLQARSFLLAARIQKGENFEPRLGLDILSATKSVLHTRALESSLLPRAPIDTVILTRNYKSTLPKDVLREQAILFRRSNPSDTNIVYFYHLAKQYDGEDRFYLSALNIACGTDPARRDAILADFEKHFPEWNDKVADLVWELRPKSMLPKLEKLLADAKLTAAQKARIIDILASSDDVSAGKAMLNLLAGDYPAEVKARAVENLKLFLPTKWKALQTSQELNTVIDTLLKSPITQSTGLQLIAAANAVNRVDAVAAIAGMRQIEAIRTLGKLRTLKSVEALRSIAGDMTFSPKPAAGMEAINALAALITGPKVDEISSRALTALQEQLARNDYPDMQRLALSALAGSQVGTQWLLDLAEKKQLPEALVADAGKLLRNSPYQGLRNKALLLFPAPGKLDPKKLPPIAELAKRNGNAERGKKVLDASLKGEAQCLRCHTVRGVGGSIGPDLSMIGKKASPENLFESILLPSKAIADQYLQWTVENSAGQKITGLLVEETPAALTIRDANGKDTKIPKADVESRRKSDVSIMPDNIVAAMTEDDLIDLVAYLYTLKTASLTPEVWHVVGPFDNGPDDSGLDAVYPPEKAVDLAASYKGKASEVKWKTVRQNGAGYVDLAAHYGGGGASNNTASYVYQVIDSPADQPATVLLGNDDGAKLWVNGELVFTNRDHFAATPERHKVPVKLKKGPNAVLMKIVNGNEPHGFYFSVTSEQELKVAPTK